MNDTVSETQAPEPPPAPPEIPKQTDRHAGSSDDGGTDTQTQDDARAETDAALKAEHDAATGKGMSVADGVDTLQPTPETQAELDAFKAQKDDAAVRADGRTYDPETVTQDGVVPAQGEQVRAGEETATAAANEYTDATDDSQPPTGTDPMTDPEPSTTTEPRTEADPVVEPDPEIADPAADATDATSQGQHDDNVDQDGVTVDEQAETGSLEGRKEVQVFDPDDPGRTITDIDDIQGGVLWEEKSATFAGDNTKWVDKQVTDKLEKYVEAREHLPGYEDAPIGLRMTEPGVDPALRTEIENAIDQFRQAHPGVDVRLEFAE